MILNFINKSDINFKEIIGFGSVIERNNDCSGWDCVCDCDCHDEGICQCADCTGNCDDCW